MAHVHRSYDLHDPCTERNDFRHAGSRIFAYLTQIDNAAKVSGMATQGERRARDAPAPARRRRRASSPSAGVEGASVDAIAEAADRTSGAVYDHFGGKEGLLFALLEGWVDDVAAVIGAELATATTLDERLAALWRNVVRPAAGDGRWIALEHELWSYAARNERGPRAPRPPLPRRVGRRRRGRRRVGRRRRPAASGPARHRRCCSASR